MLIALGQAGGRGEGVRGGGERGAVEAGFAVEDVSLVDWGGQAGVGAGGAGWGCGVAG